MDMNRLFKRHWPLLGLCLLAVLVGYYALRSGALKGPAARIGEVISSEGLKLKDVQYTHEDPDEGVKWILDAQEVSFSGDKDFIKFYEFNLRIEPENRPWIEVKGRRGTYSRDSGKINLWEDLEGISGDGYKLETEHILIKEKRRQMSSDQPVKISGSFFSVEGDGLFVDFEKKKVRVISNVTTTLYGEFMI